LRVVVVVVAAAAFLLGRTTGDEGGGAVAPQAGAKQASPDIPPVEFAYLDSGRVLAYLGQIEGGLAASQNRSSSAKRTTKASLTAKEIAAAEASAESLRESSETVTLTEADRFYTLLRILRADQGGPGEKGLQRSKR